MTVCLAFDRDAAGDLLANQVRELGGPKFERIKTPVGKDWNEFLKLREHEFIGINRRTARLCRAR
jgi:DNA primase